MKNKLIAIIRVILGKPIIYRANFYYPLIIPKGSGNYFLEVRFEPSIKRKLQFAIGIE